jgi:hypothetical protein
LPEEDFKISDITQIHKTLAEELILNTVTQNTGCSLTVCLYSYMTISPAFLGARNIAPTFPNIIVHLFWKTETFTIFFINIKQQLPTISVHTHTARYFVLKLL